MAGLNFGEELEFDYATTGPFLDHGGEKYNLAKSSYGIVGDGVVDDTAAIQSALSSLPDGATAFLPRYMSLRVTSQITVTSKSINIESNGATFIESTVINEPILNFNGCPYSTVRGLRLTGVETEAGYSGSLAQDRIFVLFNNCLAPEAHDIHITNKSGGVRLVGCERGRVSDVSLRGVITSDATADPNQSWVVIVNGGSNNHVSGCYGENVGGVVVGTGNTNGLRAFRCDGLNLFDNGCYVSSGRYCAVLNCDFENVSRGTGVKMRGIGHTVSFNKLRNVNTGISVSGNGVNADTYGFNGHGTTVSYNYIDGTDQHGIHANSQDGLTARNFDISHNFIRNAAGNAGNFCSILITAPSKGNQISYNIVENSGGTFAIRASGGETTDSDFSHNRTFTSNRGMQLQNLNDCTVIGNTCESTSGTYAIEVVGMVDSVYSGNVPIGGTLRFNPSSTYTNNRIFGNRNLSGITDLSFEITNEMYGNGGLYDRLMFGNLNRIQSGSGSPEGAIIGKRGDIYTNRMGGAGNTFWIKESGDDTNTGWIAK